MWTAQQLAAKAGVSHVTVLYILKDILCMWTNASCWVIHHLSKSKSGTIIHLLPLT
jgi:hypothetical protein